jgi:hypothetical protein
MDEVVLNGYAAHLGYRREDGAESAGEKFARHVNQQPHRDVF